MKITRVEVIPLARRLERAYVGGTYRIVNRNTIVTRIHTDAGLTGEAFGGDEDQTQAEVVAVMREHLAPLLLGEDPRDVERLWEKMFRAPVDLNYRALHVLDLSKRGTVMQAIAALDIALWDAIGKIYAAPLSRLLGGFRQRVPVIAIGGYYAPDGDHRAALAEEIAGYRRRGLAGLKMKVGRASLAEDMERVRLARELAGPDFILTCDANQAWTPPEAVAFCREVAPLNIAWIEEPVQWYDQLDGLRYVSEAVPIPVNAGQGEITRFGCRDLVNYGRVKILNVDATIAGGVSEWRRVAHLAGLSHVQMAHHEEAQVALHLLAAIPHGLYVEVFDRQRDPLMDELLVTPPAIRDGCMELSDRPGLGLELDAAVIEKYRVS